MYESAGELSVFLNQQDAIDYATGQEANKFSSAGVSRARRHQSLRPLNYWDELEIINGLNGDGQDSWRYAAIS